MAEQGYRVGIVDLTDGEPTPLSPGPEARLAEAKKAGEILGVAVRLTLDLPNRRLFDSFEARVALAKVFRTYRPRLVLGLGDRTPLASPDHWQARQITDAGVFYSRLTKWDEHFDGLPVHTVRTQLYYFLNHQSLELPTIGNSFVHDIGGNLPRKIAAVRAFESQFPPAKDHLFRRLEAAAEFLRRNRRLRRRRAACESPHPRQPRPAGRIRPKVAGTLRRAVARPVKPFSFGFGL